MKKLLIILLLIVGCDNKQKQSTHNNTSNYWMIKYFVNQDNQPTDVGYITNINPIIGTFSNSTFKENPLKVKIMIKERAVGIKLYENAGTVSVKANKQYPIEYNMTIKHDNNIIDYINSLKKKYSQKKVKNIVEDKYKLKISTTTISKMWNNNYV